MLFVKDFLLQKLMIQIPDDIVVIKDNNQSIEYTETLSYKSFSSICNELYSVIKTNNELSTFVVGMLLEMKEVIISKQNKNLDINRMITHFSNFKNTFSSLEKDTWLILIEPSSSSTQENMKKKNSNHELSKKNWELLSHKK